ncbi:MAG TPA: helix-turn-helix transcriptional regulator [Alphaproteobacteria bacterium]|jgi:phage repressor protein C with HTH and peptisase S24 domain|nr:helix-turn-helix transcriptional regulator [Alphaproteobacteria bacterium]HRK98711.1 helix-turn-helix transcriptional regulator [Alphaproteobacteria bacterium]
MFTHQNIWLALDRLANACGYSTSGLARKAGLDPTSFNRSKRIGPDGKPRWPSTESISRVLEATGSPLSDFISLLEKDKDLQSAHPQIPLLGYAQAGKDGYFDADGFPAGEGWEYIHFPYPNNLGQEDQKVYALEVSGDSMLPLFRAGDRLIIAPSTTVRRGDRVVVKTAKGEVMAKELLRQTASKIELKSLNPEHENRSFSTAEIHWIARIIWVSQ